MKRYAVVTMMILGMMACGKQGPAGAPGRDGVDGRNGLDGQGCVVTSVGISAEAPNGGSLITCADSSSLVLNGTNGTNGTNGSNGADGQNGSNGTNGTPGTVITMTQLCPGATVYPSKFIEVVACIGGEFFGVYSANGGFLTKLPAGYYGSQGINSSCNFNILAGCQVQN